MLNVFFNCKPQVLCSRALLAHALEFPVSCLRDGTVPIQTGVVPAVGPGMGWYLTPVLEPRSAALLAPFLLMSFWGQVMSSSVCVGVPLTSVAWAQIKRMLNYYMSKLENAYFWWCSYQRKIWSTFKGFLFLSFFFLMCMSLNCFQLRFSRFRYKSLFKTIFFSVDNENVRCFSASVKFWVTFKVF